MAVELLARRRIPASRLADLLTRLDAWKSSGDPRPTFLSTHPPTSERVQQALGRAKHDSRQRAAERLRNPSRYRRFRPAGIRRGREVQRSNLSNPSRSATSTGLRRRHIDGSSVRITDTLRACRPSPVHSVERPSRREPSTARTATFGYRALLQGNRRRQPGVSPRLAHPVFRVAPQRHVSNHLENRRCRCHAVSRLRPRDHTRRHLVQVVSLASQPSIPADGGVTARMPEAISIGVPARERRGASGPPQAIRAGVWGGAPREIEETYPLQSAASTRGPHHDAETIATGDLERACLRGGPGRALLPRPPPQSHLFASDLSRDLIPFPARGSCRNRGMTCRCACRRSWPADSSAVPADVVSVGFEKRSSIHFLTRDKQLKRRGDLRGAQIEHRLPVLQRDDHAGMLQRALEPFDPAGTGRGRSRR